MVSLAVARLCFVTLTHAGFECSLAMWDYSVGKDPSWMTEGMLLRLLKLCCCRPDSSSSEDCNATYVCDDTGALQIQSKLT